MGKLTRRGFLVGALGAASATPAAVWYARVYGPRDLEVVRHSIAMLTGDHKETAAAIARELNVDEYHAGLLPERKQAIVESLPALLEEKRLLITDTTFPTVAITVPAAA